MNENKQFYELNVISFPWLQSFGLLAYNFGGENS